MNYPRQDSKTAQKTGGKPSRFDDSAAESLHSASGDAQTFYFDESVGDDRIAELARALGSLPEAERERLAEMVTAQARPSRGSGASVDV